MTRVLWPPEKGCSLHALPDPAGYPLYCIAACSTCGKWFGIGEAYDGFGGYPHVWVQVRWYHFRLRRRIQNYLRHKHGGADWTRSFN